MTRRGDRLAGETVPPLVILSGATRSEESVPEPPFARECCSIRRDGSEGLPRLVRPRFRDEALEEAQVLVVDGEHLLRVPLDAEDEAPVGMFHRLDRAVGAAPDDAQARRDGL